MMSAAQEKSHKNETAVPTVVSKEAPMQSVRKTSRIVPAVDFKYYIHDTAEGYRLQLLGSLTDHCVSELNCCWLTARTTLKGRKLILDLRGVKHVDERGRQWLAGMGLEGASYIPDSFLRDTLAGDASMHADKAMLKFNIFDRLLSALRGCPASAE
jgi:hypothetical protein